MATRRGGCWRLPRLSPSCTDIKIGEVPGARIDLAPPLLGQSAARCTPPSRTTTAASRRHGEAVEGGTHSPPPPRVPSSLCFSCSRVDYSPVMPYPSSSSPLSLPLPECPALFYSCSFSSAAEICIDSWAPTPFNRFISYSPHQLAVSSGLEVNSFRGVARKAERASR